MIDIQLFVSTFVLIFLAELPDKTAFATVMLAARGRALPVFVGVAIAFVVQSLVAVVFGKLLGQLPPRLIHIAAGVMFFVFAVQAWRCSRESEEEDDSSTAPQFAHGFLKLAWTSFVVIFIAEWGDITQLATAALVAKSSDVLTIFCAAVSALWAVTLLAVLVGRVMQKYIRPATLQRIAAVAFLLVGVYMITS